LVNAFKTELLLPAKLDCGTSNANALMHSNKLIKRFNMVILVRDLSANPL
jgi:hypothetical protein